MRRSSPRCRRWRAKRLPVIRSGLIQALNFGVFLAIWLALGLHLTSPEMGYGLDTVGYLAALALVSLVATPRIGRWADKVGAVRARARITVVQLAGMLMMPFVGHSLWLILIPLILSNIVGPSIDVTNRVAFLTAAPSARTRLMTVYIILMFVGAGVGSFAGTATFEWAGWQGTAWLTVLLSACGTTLAVTAPGAWRRSAAPEPAVTDDARP